MPVSKKTPAISRRAAPARPSAEKKAKATPAAPIAGAVKKPFPAKVAAKPAGASAKKPAPAPKPATQKPAVAKPAPKPAAQKPVAAKPSAAKAAAKPAPAARPAKAAAKKAVPAAKPAAKKAVPAAKPAAAKKPAAKPAAPKPAPRKEAKAPAPKPAPPKPVPPPKPAPSPFGVGDKVVYPHHGAAVIARKEKLPFQGQRTDYFVLEVATDQLILKVPVHKAVEQGVRPVISQTVARKVLATFKSPPEEAGANWSRWYKLLTEKINSGDIFQVAEVVRDLTFAQQTKGISPALKRMLSKARLILASELRFALDVSEEEAMRRLDKSLPKAEVPEEF
jgi:CarD family transcriptional regulator